MGVLYMDLCCGEEVNIGELKLLVRKTGPDVCLRLADDQTLKLGQSMPAGGAEVTVMKVGKKARLKIVAANTIRITRQFTHGGRASGEPPGS